MATKTYDRAATEAGFPVLWQGTPDYKLRLEALGCPRTVPWGFIAKHEATCQRYHSQTVQRLAERGGLAPEEILVVINPPYTTAARVAAWRMPPAQSVPLLKAALAEYASDTQRKDGRDG